MFVNLTVVGLRFYLMKFQLLTLTLCFNFAFFAEAEEPNKRILFVGDSLTAGFGLDSDRSFPILISERILEKSWPFEVVAAGVSGETSAGGLRRINWLLKKPVDVLILELGANDGLRGLNPDDTYSNLAEIVARTRSKYPDAVVLLAGMKVPPNMGTSFTKAFESIYPRLQKDLDIALIPFLLEGVAGEQEFNLGDGIHPNEAGHKRVAEHVWRYLEPILNAVMSGQ